MTLRKIVTLPDPVLRRKAHTVTKFDKNLQTLIDDMVETMREAPGLGSPRRRSVSLNALSLSNILNEPKMKKRKMLRKRYGQF